MDLQLEGRRTLVTGSSSGIGEETARMLSQEGARVVVHGRNRERAEKVAHEIGAAGVAIGELQDDDLINAVHAQATQVLGGNIEILINNAGPGPDELSIDSTHAKAHRSAAGSKRVSGRKRSAARAVAGHARSTAWPMIAADRSRSP